MNAEKRLRALARNNPGPAREVLHDLLLEQGREAEMPVLLESPEAIEALRLKGLREQFLAQARHDLKNLGTGDIRAVRILKKMGDSSAADIPLEDLFDDDDDVNDLRVPAADLEASVMDGFLDRAQLEVRRRINQRRRDDAFFVGMERARREEG